MSSPPIRKAWPSLDDMVEAYEAAQARDGAADLQSFLPPSDHPDYLAIVCELVRVDLEYSWQRGRPNRLEHYERLFPELFRDPDRLQQVALEEYRLRQGSGEDPSPLEYQRRFGVNGVDWPPLLEAPGTPRSRLQQALEDDSAGSSPENSSEIEMAASAYQNFRLGHPEGAANLEASFAFHKVPRASAELFNDLHQSNPRAAERLARAVTNMPPVGSDFLSFRLVGELGRGAFGRVYLARQGDLANRLVALKVSADIAGETHALAQLQRPFMMLATRQGRKRHRLALESLETRNLMATFGVPWSDASHLTLSFAPDGTQIAGHTSTLFQTMNAQMPSAVWQQEILQAFQTWAIQANINISVVPDGGQPFGVAGKTQHDPRFGDIRIGAQKMSPDALSISVPNDPFLSTTLGGDVLINTSDIFNSQNLDLESVLLHEAGHVFGIPDGTDPNSPMYSHYNGARKLTSGDVKAIQALYGVRALDTHEGSSGNDTISKATQVPFPGGYTGATPLVVSGMWAQTATRISSR